jgi:putative Holliday junction resolvase
MPFRSRPTDGSTSPTGVILAIDYGQKRLGLALSDEHGVTSRTFATWTRTNRRQDLGRLRDLVRDHRIRKIIVGLPLHLDGSPSEMSQEAIAFSNRVARAIGLPVEMVDERLSSWEARQMMSTPDAPAPSRRRAQHSAGPGVRPIDDVAASIILSNYLNRDDSADSTANGVND